jgi:hypothetical protein
MAVVEATSGTFRDPAFLGLLPLKTRPFFI